MSQIHRQSTCPFFKCMSSFFKVLEYIKQSREELHFLSVLLFSSLSLGLLLCSFFLTIFLQPWKTLILVLLTRPKPWFLGRFLRCRAASRCICVAFPRSRSTLLIIFMVWLLRSFGMPCRVAMSWAARCGVRPYVRLVAVYVWKLFVERTLFCHSRSCCYDPHIFGRQEWGPSICPRTGQVMVNIRSPFASSQQSFPILVSFYNLHFGTTPSFARTRKWEGASPPDSRSIPFFVITHFRRTFDVH